MFTNRVVSANGIDVALRDGGRGPAVVLAGRLRGPRLGWAGPLGEPLLTPAEREAYAVAFERTGFTGGIDWYRNIDRNWETTAALAEARIRVPALMVTSEWDAALRPELAEPMRALVDDLEMRMIPQCGHWTQQEKPAGLNAILVDRLQRRVGGSA